MFCKFTTIILLITGYYRVFSYNFDKKTACYKAGGQIHRFWREKTSFSPASCATQIVPVKIFVSISRITDTVYITIPARIPAANITTASDINVCFTSAIPFCKPSNLVIALYRPLFRSFKGK